MEEIQLHLLESLQADSLLGLYVSSLGLLFTWFQSSFQGLAKSLREPGALIPAPTEEASGTWEIRFHQVLRDNSSSNKWKNWGISDGYHWHEGIKLSLASWDPLRFIRPTYGWKRPEWLKYIQVFRSLIDATVTDAASCLQPPASWPLLTLSACPTSSCSPHPPFITLS